MGSTGLSGVVAAILITAIITAGLTSTIYINQRASNLFQRQAEEALRQAKLNQELVRIYIHSEDGTLDTPAYITFVNGWGFETKILKIIIISKNMTVMSEVNLDPPLVIKPGRHVRITPSTIGLNYPSFKALADRVAALIAYTEAGNRFGSTWGFPREDNLAGATTITTYNYTTTRLWNVPRFITLNRTITLPSITTLNPPPNITYAQIYARAHFENIELVTVPYLRNWNPLTMTVTIDDAIVQGTPSHPNLQSGTVHRQTVGPISLPNRVPTFYSDRGIGYSLWYWLPRNGFYTVSGDPVTVERNTYYVVYNSPKRYIINLSGENGYCVVSYSLARVEITPLPRAGFISSQSYTTRKGMVMSFTHAYVPNPPGVSGYWDRVWPSSPYNPRAGPEFTVANNLEANLFYNGERVAAGYPLWYVFMSAPIPTTTTTYLGSYAYHPNGWGYWKGVARPVDLTTIPLNPVAAAYILIGNADTYVVDRYYYVDQVTCNVYTPQPPLPAGSYTGPPNEPPEYHPPPKCHIEVIVLQEFSSGSSGGGSGGGGGGSGGSGGSGGGDAPGVIRVSYRAVCPPGVLR